ncbi:hypothetical protein P389DRAFT_174749 [Cystobasidium minutum MCA 4210]|uniref:uncharacterized protein n=1 Tax=Cystobasidium minutum MCA 4210 TaxID=1397322 RepID=UPI0034CFC092|eukprot:jgi/Rhomi1/174749/fgenesh1_kg.8_\
MARRPFRPSLTSEPSEEHDIMKTRSQPVLDEAANLGDAGTTTAMTVDVDSGGMLANSASSGNSQAHGTAGNHGDGDDERSSLLGKSRKVPWYRRPHPGYIHVSMLIMALGMGLLAAAKIEQYTQIICHQINSDIMDAHPGESQEELLPILLLTPEQCRHSTKVQKKVAQLNLFANVIMGTLCIVTAPYLGALSDRIGRKFCISINAMSIALGDLMLLVVLSYPSKIPYMWVLLCPFVEGVFAGMGGGQSIMGAYIGDCTGAGSRASVFSVMMGVVFAGIAIGPAIGSLSIQLTGNPLTPFYIALIMHTLQFILNATIMPESLSKDKQVKARQTHEEKRKKSKRTDREDAWIAQRDNHSLLRKGCTRVKATCRPATSVLEPLGLLGPRERDDGRLDWSLPVLALSTGFYTMMMSTYSVKMQYAQLKFGWTSVQLGNFISLVGATRIVALCVAIPLLIKLIRKPHKEPERDPHPSAVNADGANDEEEAGSSSSSRTARDPRNVNASGFSKIEDEEWDAHKKQHRLIHDYKFDLRLARMSLLIDVASYTALCFTSTVSHFILFVMLQALGSGANPALSSLCLMFADPNETGSLMGALSVLQIIFAQVFGPIIFNGVYSATVETWPEAFFVVGASTFGITFVCLLFVRVRRPSWNGYSTDATEEEPLPSDMLPA